MAARLKTDISAFERRMLLLSLLYGKPDPRWADPQFFYNDNSPEAGRFREAAFKVFDHYELARVGAKRVARDFAEWYEVQEQSNEGRSEDRLRPEG